MAKGTGKGKLTKAIHLRRNGWGIGAYDSFKRDGEIIVGQLCYIDMDNSIGTFRGFVLSDLKGDRQGQYREWTFLLSLKEPSKVHPTWIFRYEELLRGFYGND